MKIVLFPHLQSGCANQAARQVCQVLHQNQLSVWADPRNRDLLSDMAFVRFADFLEAVESADVAIAIGGDGTMLHCARPLVDRRLSCVLPDADAWQADGRIRHMRPLFFGTQ